MTNDMKHFDIFIFYLKMTMLRQFVLLPILTAPLWAAAAAIDCFRAEFEESTTGASGYFQLGMWG